MEATRLRSTPVIIVSSLLGYLSFRLFLDGLFTVPGVGTVLLPSAGMAVPLGAAVGVPGVAGLAIGAFLSDVVSGTFSTSAFFYTISVVLLAYFAHVLYRYDIGGQIRSDHGPVLAAVRFVLLAAVACSGAAAFLAFGYQMAGITPFYITAVSSFIEFAISTAIVAPLFGLLVVLDDALFSYRPSRRNTVSSSSRVHRWAILVVLPLWLLVGFVGSIGFKLRERVSLEGFQNFNAEFLYHAVHPDIFGQGGRRAQVLLGVLALMLFVASATTLDRQDGGVE